MATLILVWGIRRRSRRRRQCRGTWYHLDTHEHHSGYTPRSTAIVEAPRNRRGRGASRLALGCHGCRADPSRSEEHTSELQSLMRISYAVFCLKKKTQHYQNKHK